MEQTGMIYWGIFYLISAILAYVKVKTSYIYDGADTPSLFDAICVIMPFANTLLAFFLIIRSILRLTYMLDNIEFPRFFRIKE